MPGLSLNCSFAVECYVHFLLIHTQSDWVKECVDELELGGKNQESAEMKRTHHSLRTLSNLYFG